MGYYEIKKSKKETKEPYYFVLKAANHEIVTLSKMYENKQETLKAIAFTQKKCDPIYIRDGTIGDLL